jgi:hypothetical protein
MWLPGIAHNDTRRHHEHKTTRFYFQTYPIYGPFFLVRMEIQEEHYSYRNFKLSNLLHPKGHRRFHIPYAILKRLNISISKINKRPFISCPPVFNTLFAIISYYRAGESKKARTLTMHSRMDGRLTNYKYKKSGRKWPRKDSGKQQRKC